MKPNKRLIWYHWKRLLLAPSLFLPPTMAHTLRGADHIRVKKGKDKTLGFPLRKAIMDRGRPWWVGICICDSPIRHQRSGSLSSVQMHQYQPGSHCVPCNYFLGPPVSTPESWNAFGIPAFLQQISQTVVDII